MRKYIIICAKQWSLATCLFYVFIFAGCSKENILPENENELVGIQFSAIKVEDAATRAIGTQWENGDQIGLFALKSQTTLQSENIVDNNSNLPFATNGSGYFYPKGKNIYYPQDGSSLDIIAYYPYTANITDYAYPINISEQIDFFYSNNLKDVGKNNPGNSALNFKRVLSKLVINITPKTDGASLENLSVVLNGSKTKASFSLSTGILTADKSSVAEIALPVSGNATQKQLSALLLPTESGDQLTITFNAGTDSYTWTLPHTLEAGKMYSYNIKLNGSKPEITQSGYMEIPAYSTGTEAPNSAKALHMVGSKNWLNSSYTYNSESIRNYTILFDTQNRVPYWVAYPMHPMYLTSGNRTDAWEYDPTIPKAQQPTLFSGWSTNGIDRGHLLASADRNASREINKTTFYFTNMAAQNSSMNGGTWAKLEERVRYWCKQSNYYDTLYVVTGCILPVPPEQVKYTNDNDGKRSAIPKYLYKALLRKKKSTGAYTSIAFKMENANTGISYTNSAISVADLEKETGFTFFTKLPSDVASGVKQNTSLSPEWN